MIAAMLLVIDAGNTHVRLGLARDGVLFSSRRAATRPRGTPDELEVLIEDLLRLDGQDLSAVAAMAISSTVPALEEVLGEIAARRRNPGPGRRR